MPMTKNTLVQSMSVALVIVPYRNAVMMQKFASTSTTAKARNLGQSRLKFHPNAVSAPLPLASVTTPKEKHNRP